MSTSETQPKVLWDESAVNEVHFPNFCNVASSARDVTLLFGNNESWAGGDSDLTVSIRERVVLRPVAAKLLGALLQKTLAEYEARYGEIEAGFQGLPGSQPITPAASTAKPFTTEGMPEPAKLLHELVRGLGVRHDAERSMKFLPGALLTERLLLGLNRSELPPQAGARLPVLCKRLQMPEEFANALREQVPSADFLHFGFEAGEEGNVYKVYVEFADELARAMRETPGQPTSGVLYVGYKWNPEENSRRAVSTYTFHSALSREAISARMGAIQDQPQHAPALEAARAILDVALSRVPDHRLLYVEVTEAGNPRVSYDLNLYAAKLTVAEIYPILLPIGRHYGIPAEQIGAAYDLARHEHLGHISGGIDREGRDFISVYFGAKGA